jgi:hypothetical protein
MTRIQIQQTPGVIQIETRRAQLNVIRSQRLQLDVRQNEARLNIERRAARLDIDQTESFASSGLKTPLRMAGDFNREGLSAGLEVIASVAEEGLRFLRIENGGSPISEIAAGRGLRERRLAAAAMPAERPKVSFEPARLDISWVPHSVEAEWETQEAQVEYVPYEVSIRVATYPSIEITAQESEPPPREGEAPDNGAGAKLE